MRTDLQVVLRATDLRREHGQLQEATERYVAALPTEHRQLLMLMALHWDTTPHQLIAGVIADVIARYQREELRGTIARHA